MLGKIWLVINQLIGAKENTMPKDNIEKKGIQQILADVNETMAALEHGQTIAENTQANKVGSQDRLLHSFQEAEELGVNIHELKKLYCEANGYSFQMYDATSNEMIPVAGDKAPNVVKVNYSVGISLFKKGIPFKEVGSWKELREAIKDPDQLESLKEAEKDLNKTLKGASVQDIANATATIQKLVENLSK